MDLIPYPPEWCRHNSPEILAYWQRYSRYHWLCFWLIMRDEDRRAAWRITATSGIATIILVILLFLEAWPTRPVRPVVLQDIDSAPLFVEVETKTEVEVPVVEISSPVEVRPAPETWPSIERQSPPKEFVDPFEQFAPPPEQPTPPPQAEPPSVPSFNWSESFPLMREPEPEPEPVRLPDLKLSATVTDLPPHPEFFEHTINWSADSRAEQPDPLKMLANNRWRQGDAFDNQPFETPTTNQWTTDHKPVELERLRSDNQVANGRKPNGDLPTGLKITKHCPPNVTGGSAFTYTITLHNQGKERLEFVRVSEQASDLEYLHFDPPARLHQEHYCWDLTGIAPGSQRTLKVTCRAVEPESVLKLATSVEVMHALIQKTEVFVPDVIVEITLPVEVTSGKDFPLEITISNNSQKAYDPSPLKLDLLTGLEWAKDNKQETGTAIEVPGPGKSLKLNFLVTPTEVGEATLRANLVLQETLTVPVTAYTKVVENPNNSDTFKNLDPKSPVIKKQANRLAVSDR